MLWKTTRFDLNLSRPLIMGIVNLTPDSFSDGGALPDASAALVHCEALMDQGADILDLGAESSRPGAEAVSVEEELARLVPVLKAAVTLGVPVSVDTCKPQVMQVALDLGADIINDIGAFVQEGAVQVVAAHGRCGVCVMHMQGNPQTMQDQPQYDHVVVQTRDFLSQRVELLCAQGIARARIAIDPGIGFGKSVSDNLTLLADQAQFLSLGQPLLVGWSRKSTLGHVTGQPVHSRVHASVAAALMAVQNGAHVVRVHDVAATRDALLLWQAVRAVKEHPRSG